MKKLSIEAATQIRNLRNWCGIFDRATLEEDGPYLRSLRCREDRLTPEARDAWFRWSHDEVTAALNAESAVLTDGEIEVRESKI